MRLIGDLTTEKNAISFSEFLQSEKIKNSYEPFEEPSSGKKGFHIWIFEEDDCDHAIILFEKFKQNPTDPVFEGQRPLPPIDESMQDFKTEEKGKVLKLSIKRKESPFAYILTYSLFFICIALFLINMAERKNIEKEQGRLAEQILLTPVQKTLMFDYPAAMKDLETVVAEFPVTTGEDFASLPQKMQQAYTEAEKLPYWKGFYAMIMQYKQKSLSADVNVPLFEKIREGEVWRLFTPCLLHSDFLHILFNMAWLWVLGRQIEQRISKGRLLLFVLFVGIASNVLQYLMSGPFFLGYSGVVVGMAGFIWSRQRVAPWEGYPLQRTTLLFIVFFVMVMFALEIASFVLHYLSYSELTPNIANTAHVVGGLSGALLGRFKFFARGEAS
ncbi:MAG: rhomboid family intramembrane serine protease [Chlamydiae bacterium]|nr:rhomboid family intramembrane serine protease [Chlamydiota bacterium]